MPKPPRPRHGPGGEPPPPHEGPGRGPHGPGPHGHGPGPHGPGHPRPHHPDRGPHGDGHGRGPLPRSRVDGLIDRGRIDGLLAPWIVDPGDRAFVVRCITQEGPIHHRGASYVLLALLAEALEAAPAGSGEAIDPGGDEGSGDAVAVPLRLPPHLEDHALGEREYPLRLPLAPLRRLAGGGPGSDEAAAAMADALVDGPPHHALANAAMVRLLDALLRRLEGRG